MVLVILESDICVMPLFSSLFYSVIKIFESRVKSDN